MSTTHPITWTVTENMRQEQIEQIAAQEHGDGYNGTLIEACQRWVAEHRTWTSTPVGTIAKSLSNFYMKVSAERVCVMSSDKSGCTIYPAGNISLTDLDKLTLVYEP